MSVKEGGVQWKINQYVWTDFQYLLSSTKKRNPLYLYDGHGGQRLRNLQGVFYTLLLHAVSVKVRMARML